MISEQKESAAWYADRRIGMIGLSALLALGTFAHMAAAQPNHGRQDAHRDGDDHRGGDRRGWGGGYYARPPVVYSAPYYYPPPVVYGPQIGVRLGGVRIGID